MTMKLEMVTAPTFSAVHIEEARAKLSIEDGYRDADLAAELAASCEDIETRLDLALTRRTYRGWLDCWPLDLRWGCQQAVTLPMGPAISVTSVTTYDAYGAATAMDPSGYRFIPSRLGGMGRRPTDGMLKPTTTSWPQPGQVGDGICIEWVAGFETPGQIPERARNAILLLTRHRFDEDPAKSEPPGVKDLLRNLRSWAV